MNPTADEGLVRRLPLPLAQLYRRAYNAKTPLERHQAAYYLWEAALKLLSAVVVVDYSHLGRSDPAEASRLRNVVRPSLGHWWEFIKRLVPILVEAGPAGDRFRAVRDWVLGPERDDLPRATGLDAALREVLESKPGARSTVRLSDLFDRLVRYRNKEFGHGAQGQRSTEFYDRMGRSILSGVGEILACVDLLAGYKLVYIADVRRQASGEWLIERYELVGESARRIESLELPRSETVKLPDPDVRAGAPAGLERAQATLHQATSPRMA